MEGGHGTGDGSGSHGNRGHMRVPSNSQRGYVHSARGSSDILSSGDDGPTYPRADVSDVSRTTEGRQSSRTSHNNTASTSKKSKRLSFGRKPRAEVSWADKKSLDADKYTFFRDPTPPPPEEKAFGAGVVPTTYDYKYDHVAPPAPLPTNNRSCGLRKKTLWLILAAILIAIAVAVGVGVGVGVGSSGGSSSSDSSSDADGSGSSDETSTSNATTPTSSSSSETSTSAPARATTTSRASCPAANNTIYSVPGSDKTFLRVCGIDYSGEFGGDERARDIGMVITKNMEDCIVNCAGYPGCTGCGWGVIQGDEGSEHRCWLKSRLGKSHVARPGWDFAILQ